jgi:hypothetical protein
MLHLVGFFSLSSHFDQKFFPRYFKGNMAANEVTDRGHKILLDAPNFGGAIPPRGNTCEWYIIDTGTAGTDCPSLK